VNVIWKRRKMVIPFLPEATLDAHPAFARLWTYITTEVLEDDASRKSVNQEKERVEGWRARVDTARRDLAAAARKPEDDDGYALHGEHSPEDEERVRGPGKGTVKEEDKEKLSFEEALNKARVETMRMEILRDVLVSSTSTSSVPFSLLFAGVVIVYGNYFSALAGVLARPRRALCCLSSNCRLTRESARGRVCMQAG
jgi:hypothetical protein